MDLGQVEVIKGNTSALYGSAAMAGVVLISRPQTPARVSRQPLTLSNGRFDVPGLPLSSH
jgi:outer membrane receptor protein involved in Fe transport